MKKLENILKGGKKLLVGAGLVSLLSVPAIVGCGQEDGNGSYTTSGSEVILYDCDCEGAGLSAIMQMYATTLKEAEYLATKKCNQDYPGADCVCDCSSPYCHTAAQCGAKQI